MSHANAPFTVEGRRRLCPRVGAGRPIAHVAAEAGISRQCLSTWHGRFLAEGEAGLADRSSRPLVSPTWTSPQDGSFEPVIAWKRQRRLEGIDQIDAVADRSRADHRRGRRPFR